MSCVIPPSEIGIELGLQMKVILTVSCVIPTPPTQNHTNPNHDAYFTNINLDEEISVARSNYSILNNEQQPIVDTIFNDLQQYGPISSY